MWHVAMAYGLELHTRGQRKPRNADFFLALSVGGVCKKRRAGISKKRGLRGYGMRWWRGDRDRGPGGARRGVFPCDLSC
jgi:hypothetical protein